MRNKELLFEAQTLSTDGSEELLSVSHLTGVGPRSEKNVTMTKAESLDGYRVVEQGDLVINTMWAWMGALGVARHAGIVSPAYGVYRPRPSAPFEPRFFDYLYRSTEYVMEMNRVSRGIWSSRLRIYPEVFLRMAVPMPPLEEQRAIADYLDRETARIDTLIEEQQRLIEMLRERRQAVVHRSVGGLDRIACRPTNDSWWPKLPEGWAPLRLRRVIRGLADGPHFSPNYVDEGVMFLSARNIRVDGWSLDDAKFVSEEDYLEFSKRVVPEPGDVLYTKGGTTGIARVVDLDFPFQVWVHVAVLKVRRDLVDPHFLAYALNSPPCYEQSQLFTRGATNNDLGLTRMVNIVLPVPPLEQQRQIIATLDQQTAKIDTLITESRQFIELARERRSAVITAAVTGQIDVREAA
ncbi:hypothetical protein MPTA5024_24740 [Microbispora sp. ATCC PTA-5024]|nr:hypothetical protein MPTA5024_24740 [Microbispora sp. ATCC PTA-5024]